MNNKSQATSNKRRKYDSELRRAKKDETRQRILDTLVEKMVQENFSPISMEEIAKAAGIGPATLYRHFPNREALWDGLSEEFNRRVGAVPYPQTPADIADHIEHDFAIFDQFPGLVQAFFMSGLGQDARSRGRARRIQAIQNALGDLLDPLDESKRTQVTAIIAYLASLQSWITMTSEFDMSGEEIGQAVSWAIHTLVASLAHHHSSNSLLDDEG